jgi:hypothetical protein
VAHLAITSIAAGLALGIPARVVMRFVALESGLDPGFSIGGSLEVIAFTTLVAAPAAAVFLATRHRIPIRRPWVGLVYGAAVFFTLAAWPPPAARSALTDTPDTPASTAVAFALLFLGWGLGLEWLSRWLGRPLARA